MNLFVDPTPQGPLQMKVPENLEHLFPDQSLSKKSKKNKTDDVSPPVKQGSS